MTGTHRKDGCLVLDVWVGAALVLGRCVEPEAQVWKGRSCWWRAVVLVGVGSGRSPGTYVCAPGLGAVRPHCDRRCDLSPERPLHFAEKVLPILHGLGTDSYLVVKRHPSMEAMLLYLGRWCTGAGGPAGLGRLVGPFIWSLGRSCSGRGGLAGRPLWWREQAGAVSFTWGPSPGCPCPWASGRGSPCPLQSSPSQPCGRHQARHDEVP